MDVPSWLGLGALVAAVAALPAVPAARRPVRRGKTEDFFRSTLEDLRRSQLSLTRWALQQGPDSWRQPDFPLFAKVGWIFERPIDLDQIKIDRIPAPEGDEQRIERNTARGIASSRMRHVASYSEAVVAIGHVKGLYNGRTYRLLDVKTTGRLSMMFSDATYFPYLDTSEVLSFEASARKTARKRIAGPRSYRRRLANPFDFSNRVAGLGIDTLTIRKDGGRAGFFVHSRDPEKVVNNADMIGVVPAGEFTPGDKSEEAMYNDFDLWKNIMREYAEEFLGMPDAQGRGGHWIDFENESPYRELNRARKNGKLSIKVLGIGIDPLPWKPELLTVCIFQADAFDSIFADRVDENEEGLIISGRQIQGLPFNEETVKRYCNSKAISPSAEACLRLAWKQREELGLAPREPARRAKRRR